MDSARDGLVAFQTREAVAVDAFDEAAMTIQAVVATSTPVRRRDKHGPFWEILDPVGLDLSALEDVPLLDSHNRSTATATIGRASDFRIEGEQVVALLRFSGAEDVAPLVARVRDGTLKHFSIGYSVTSWREERDQTGRKRIAEAWAINEVSLVSMPADINAKKRGIDMALDDSEEAQRAALIDDLAELARLPEEWKTRMHEAGDEMTVDEIRQSALEEQAVQQAQKPRIRVHAASSEDPTVVRSRQADAVAYRMAGGELPEPSREYASMSFRDLAQDSLTRAGQATRGLSADELFMRAATTSDFPLVVSHAANKVALDAYRAAESPLKRIARQRKLPNFKQSMSIRLGEMGRLEEMSESGEFVHVSRAEQGEPLQLGTYGRAFSVSRQLMIDDDLGLLGDITSAMGQAAAQTEADLLVATFTGNPLMSDGTAVFDASRGNYAASGLDLDQASLDVARQAMRTVKGLDGKTIIDAAPRFLIVGPELETTAEKLLASIYPATSDNVNPFAQRMELIVEPRIDGDGWYLTADPARVPTLQFAYLQSAQGVQIQRAESWDTLGMKFRAFLDFGTSWVDWRGAYHGTGAA